MTFTADNTALKQLNGIKRKRKIQKEKKSVQMLKKPIVIRYFVYLHLCNCLESRFTQNLDRTISLIFNLKPFHIGVFFVRKRIFRNKCFVL